MKVKVLKNFGDKEDGKFKIKDTEFECGLERAKELEELGYVELLEELPKEKETKRIPSKKDIAKK